jgi:hypothetical protein
MDEPDPSDKPVGNVMPSDPVPGAGPSAETHLESAKKSSLKIPTSTHRDTSTGISQPPSQRGRVVAVALVSGLAGGLITSGINYWNTQRSIEETRHAFILTRQENTARELLTEALSVLSLKEAWLLQGRNSQTAKLTQTKGLQETPTGNNLWLRPVEVRAVLDEAQWNAPRGAQYYDFLGGRRAWIVRNEILPNQPPTYPGRTKTHFPALISSKGWQELCGWIERVQLAYNAETLTDDGLWPIARYLFVVSQEDRIAILEDSLSPKSVKFLRDMRARLNPSELFHAPH